MTEITGREPKCWHNESGKHRMSDSGVITIRIEGHGEFEVIAEGLDLMIEKYLPASPEGLRAKIRELYGEGCEGHAPEDAGDPSMLGEAVYCDGRCRTESTPRTVIECLVMLADHHGYSA
ncbi:hypothetical protein [Streptomyces sp. 5-10]|uniref:hypothetical protein n=1 Tax=Streptomyces sp. 5-10 TaxID=878925 RepID=UPI00168BDD44|nr:hypothetical protein [Streptomyces sp. 5-10]MBD3004588.1 hypothetical protein [Streptomyces sp. 5-10]